MNHKKQNTQQQKQQQKQKTTNKHEKPTKQHTSHTPDTYTQLKQQTINTT